MRFSFRQPPVRRRRRKIFALSKTSSTNVTVTPDIDTLALTGFAPTVTASSSVSSAIDELVLTGQTPTVSASSTVTPAIDELALTGQAPTVSASSNVTPAIDELTLTGFAPDVSTGTNASAAPGIDELVLTGFAPTVTATFSTTVEPGADALILTGYAPDVSTGELGGTLIRRYRRPTKRTPETEFGPVEIPYSPPPESDPWKGESEVTREVKRLGLLRDRAQAASVDPTYSEKRREQLERLSARVETLLGEALDAEEEEMILRWAQEEDDMLRAKIAELLELLMED